MAVSEKLMLTCQIERPVTQSHMNFVFSSAPLNQKGLALIRMFFGLLLIIHGSQGFHHDEMLSYKPWLMDLRIPFPLFSAYLGKAIEFIGGVCLLLGVFTRLACILVMLTFLFITVVMADGKIFTDGQHPFLFFLIAAIFLFTGAGEWTMNNFLKKAKK
jgi:putative oxidoreductase